MPALSSARIVLDTFGLLAWIEGEEGAERVRSVLNSSSEVYIPWPVLMETFYITEREGGDDKALRRYAIMKQQPIQFLNEMSESTLLTGARLKAKYWQPFSTEVTFMPSFTEADIRAGANSQSFSRGMTQHQS